MNNMEEAVQALVPSLNAPNASSKLTRLHLRLLEKHMKSCDELGKILPTQLEELSIRIADAPDTFLFLNRTVAQLSSRLTRLDYLFIFVQFGEFESRKAVHCPLELLKDVPKTVTKLVLSLGRRQIIFDPKSVSWPTNLSTLHFASYATLTSAHFARMPKTLATLSLLSMKGLDISIFKLIPPTISNLKIQFDMPKGHPDLKKVHSATREYYENPIWEGWKPNDLK